MSEINQQAPVYSLNLNKEEEEDGLTLKALVRLFLRTWPYLKPQWPHLSLWVVARFAIEVIWVFSALVAFDLFNNKVLVGEKLQPSQASLLFLDDSYSTDFFDQEESEFSIEDLYFWQDDEEEEIAEPDEKVEPPKLTKEQQRIVRDRLMILFCITAILIFTISPAINYYRTWILQRVNQYLRVTMVERAEHLSLRYHSHARTGDAIYRAVPGQRHDHQCH